MKQQSEYNSLVPPAWPGCLNNRDGCKKYSLTAVVELTLCGGLDALHDFYVRVGKERKKKKRKKRKRDFPVGFDRVEAQASNVVVLHLMV